MVNCLKCKHGSKQVYFDHYEDKTSNCVYCYATDDYLTMSQAKDDVPCEFYEPKLDANNSEA